jgi:hypothetical protein
MITIGIVLCVLCNKKTAGYQLQAAHDQKFSCDVLFFILQVSNSI